ncbi:pirin family protein [Pseudomonas sp. 5P_3.1_Bac2]|uniref:pirin family protein n=1 Tax=Pseudomonas sp. 5P_3.1_Bac2 TaxID=2971617 RepID=UPI0021C6AF8B|nr:pirin family protein [Pseudomonas sp. 5P_3.1_Bac2]MCU1719382.1 pirin family protein [Pseudomonas sp. 5P_3.1_Bac2]
MKKILGLYGNPHQHWVGDGFPVRSLFTYDSLGQHISPFLLLDYAGPTQFEPTEKRRGVGEHPHRGFETVTIVYEGEVEHHDSTGAGGTIGPGDVQWMTAASGILHEEYHSSAFARKGGNFEMVQLWVNLPSKDKMAPPRYQNILDSDIPNIILADEVGQVRVIAGEYAGQRGPALTFSPLQVWDIRLNAGKELELNVTEGHSCAVVVLNGTVQVNQDQVLRGPQLALLDTAGTQLLLEANSDAKLLLLSGEPLNEPIVGYGPFVMNSQEQIGEAIRDFNSGRFGQIG